MFLERAGAEALPAAYLCTAISLFVVASFFLFLFNRFTPFRVYLSLITLVTFGYALFAIGLEPSSNSYAVWLAFKVFANISFVVLTTCFWFFVDQYYNLQNAKRLYALFNAAIFFGDACGAGIITFTFNAMGVRGLLLCITVLLSLAMTGIAYISRLVKPVKEDLEEGGAPTEKQSFRLLVRGIVSSKFTICLILTYLVIQTLNIVTEYCYMEGMDHHFRSLAIPESLSQDNRLTLFLGKCMAWIALGNMVFGPRGKPGRGQQHHRLVPAFLSGHIWRLVVQPGAAVCDIRTRGGRGGLLSHRRE